MRPLALLVGVALHGVGGLVVPPTAVSIVRARSAQSKRAVRLSVMALPSDEEAEDVPTSFLSRRQAFALSGAGVLSLFAPAPAEARGGVVFFPPKTALNNRYVKISSPRHSPLATIFTTYRTHSM